MEEVIKIFKELQESSGKRLQEILEEHKDNELLKKVLWFVYNPYIVTGLSSKKINKIVNKQIKYAPAKTIEEVFEYLQEHNTGTDIDIAYVLEFIQGKPDQEMYEQIFTKELKLGITSKTINKVFPNLIPEFNVMLAEKYWDRMAELDETNPDIIITQKLDGCVSGNTTIVTDKGLKTISEVVDKKLPVKVLGQNDKGKDVFTNIIDYLKFEGKPSKRIFLDNGTFLDISDDDYVMANGKYTMVHNLEVGDDLYVSKESISSISCECGKKFYNTFQHHGHIARCEEHKKYTEQKILENKKELLSKYEEGYSVLELSEEYEISYYELAKILEKDNKKRSLSAQCKTQRTKQKKENTLGVKNVSQLDWVKKKKEATFLKNYGVKNISQLPGITDKIQQSRKETLKKLGKKNFRTGVNVSKYERIVASFLNDNQISYIADKPIERYLPNNRKRYRPDLLVGNKIIEVYGEIYHADPEKYNGEDFLYGIKGKKIKVQDIWDYDKQREEYLKKCGYSILVLWEKEFKNEEWKEKVLKYLEEK